MSDEMNNCVDLLFPVNGSAIPRDHGYALYAALSRQLDRPECPLVHGATDLGIFPIRGTPAGDGTLLLHEHSMLRLRTPAAKLPMFLPLAGKSLELDGHRLRVGVPHVQALVPAAALASSLVLIKLAHAAGRDCITPDLFLAAAQRKLAELCIQARPSIPLYRNGPRAGQVRRRVIHVKDQTHVGFGMVVQGLTAEESIRLQEQGIGGRRLMGCGVFLPVSTREVGHGR